MEITIRKMEVTGWREVSEIYQQGMGTNLATFQVVCPSYEEWDSGHLPLDRLVAVCGDRVSGFAVLSAVSSRCVYSGVCEVSIYITEECRGMGIGTQLLDALIRSSEENGIWMLQSGIMSDNAASIRLHEKCGFRMVGYRERIGRDRFGQWRDTVLMERRSDTVGL